MPTYNFFCPKHKSFELFRSFADYREEEPCPKCQKTCKRDYADLETISGSVITSDTDSRMTIGRLADRNKERLSNDEKMAIQYKNNEYLYNQEPKEGVVKRDFEKDWKNQDKKAKAKEVLRKLKKDPKFIEKVKENVKKPPKRKS